MSPCIPLQVVDPNLRDKVPLPGQPPPPSHNMQHQLSPPLIPPLLPQPDYHQQQPLMGSFPPPRAPLPPQQWMGPPRMSSPINHDQTGFRLPPPMAPPPHQQWTGPAPFPAGPHAPQADGGMGVWQEPPPPLPPPPQVNAVQPEGPKLDANVPLPQGFDVKTLFPDPHPQVRIIIKLVF